MFMSTSFVLGLVVWHASVNSAVAQLDEVSDRTFACYGTANSLLSPSCPSGSLVAPYLVSAGAKNNSTGCPREIVDPGQTSQCCEFHQDDCHGRYENKDSITTSYIYHADCVGRGNCLGFARQASNMDISFLSCPPSYSYPDQTNYMFMDFYCIPDTRVGTLPTANIQSSSASIYLKGQDYVANSAGIAVTSASCSVESDDCDAVITVYALDIRLANDTSGSCTQEMYLSDTLVDCTQNNNFQINQIGLSTNNYMTVNFSSTVTNQGYLWLGFNTSSTSGDLLSLRCPAQDPQTVCTTTTELMTTITNEMTTEITNLNSTENFTDTTEETTTADEMTNTTLPSPPPTQTSKAPDEGLSDPPTIIIAVTVVVAVCVLGLVGVIIGCCIYKRSKEKTTKTPDEVKKVVPDEETPGHFPEEHLFHGKSFPTGRAPNATGFDTGKRQLNGIVTLPSLSQTHQHFETENDSSPEGKERKKNIDEKSQPLDGELQEQQEITPEENDAVNDEVKRKKKRRKKKRNYEEIRPVDGELQEGLNVPLEVISVLSDEVKRKKKKKRKKKIDEESRPVGELQEQPNVPMESIGVVSDGEVKRKKKRKKKIDEESQLAVDGELQEGLNVPKEVDDVDNDGDVKGKKTEEYSYENDNDFAAENNSKKKKKRKKKRKEVSDGEITGENLEGNEAKRHVKSNQILPIDSMPTYSQEYQN